MAFNSIHTALESAVNILLASTLCSEINLVQSPAFEVINGAIQGANYSVECLKEAEQITQDRPLLLTFNQATHREDGSILLASEILGYEIKLIENCFYGWTVTAEGKSTTPAKSCF